MSAALVCARLLWTHQVQLNQHLLTPLLQSMRSYSNKFDDIYLFACGGIGVCAAVDAIFQIAVVCLVGLSPSQWEDSHGGVKKAIGLHLAQCPLTLDESFMMGSILNAKLYLFRRCPVACEWLVSVTGVDSRACCPLFRTRVWQVSLGSFLVRRPALVWAQEAQS